MPEVFIQGGEGKLQAKYSPSEEEKPNIAIVLHPNPKHGGTMDSKVNYAAFKVMKEAGFSTLRINFRGVGKSDGAFTEGEGELNDASVSLDWLQKKNEDFRSCWIVGFSFGATPTMEGQSGSFELPLTRFGGRFGKDTDTPTDEIINDDGISHMIEGGLALKIQYEMLQNSSCRIFAKIV